MRDDAGIATEPQQRHPNVYCHVVDAGQDPGIEKSNDFARVIVEFPTWESSAELAGWWLMTAARDLLEAMPKIGEYGGTGEGSADLRLVGDSLAELLNMREVDDAIKQELGCWFYIQGKIARLVSDYQQHRPGKGDTWHDTTVYSMMARRLQAVGRWP